VPGFFNHKRAQPHLVSIEYRNVDVRYRRIHPAALVASAAAFTHEAEAMRDSDLRRLVKRVREFFKAFEGLNFADLSIPHIQKLVDAHGLSVDALLSDYSRKVKNLK
jgi:hypothetical protein